MGAARLRLRSSYSYHTSDTTRFPEATSVHPKKAILCSRKEEDKAVLTSCYALMDRRVDGLCIHVNRLYAG
jgi:hypothetical protein